ncbi:hypothetical protein COOONC_01241 [Cooperia oncophora]
MDDQNDGIALSNNSRVTRRFLRRACRKLKKNSCATKRSAQEKCKRRGDVDFSYQHLRFHVFQKRTVRFSNHKYAATIRARRVMPSILNGSDEVWQFSRNECPQVQLPPDLHVLPTTLGYIFGAQVLAQVTKACFSRTFQQRI